MTAGCVGAVINKQLIHSYCHVTAAQTILPRPQPLPKPQTDVCRASNENTHKWAIGLVNRKVLKTHEQHEICPEIQDDLKSWRMIYLIGYFS